MPLAATIRHWFSDVATYPLLAVLVGGASFALWHGGLELRRHPDMRLNQTHRRGGGDVYAHRQSVDYEHAPKPADELKLKEGNRVTGSGAVENLHEAHAHGHDAGMQDSKTSHMYAHPIRDRVLRAQQAFKTNGGEATIFPHRFDDYMVGMKRGNLRGLREN